MANIERASEALGVAEVDFGDRYLAKVQRRYDRKYFEPRSYPLTLGSIPAGQRLTVRDAKINHTAKDVAVTLGRFDTIARYQKPLQWNVWREEIAPRIFMARTRLANILGLDLESVIGNMDETQRVRGGKTLTHAAGELHKAHRALFSFATPLETGTKDTEAREHVATDAVPALHASGVILGHVVHFDPYKAHQNFIVRQVEEPNPT